MPPQPPDPYRRLNPAEELRRAREVAAQGEGPTRDPLAALDELLAQARTPRQQLAFQPGEAFFQSSPNPYATGRWIVPNESAAAFYDPTRLDYGFGNLDPSQYSVTDLAALARRRAMLATREVYPNLAPGSRAFYNQMMSGAERPSDAEVRSWRRANPEADQRFYRNAIGEHGQYGDEFDIQDSIDNQARQEMMLERMGETPIRGTLGEPVPAGGEPLNPIAPSQSVPLNPEWYTRAVQSGQGANERWAVFDPQGQQVVNAANARTGGRITEAYPTQAAAERAARDVYGEGDWTVRNLAASPTEPAGAPPWAGPPGANPEGRTPMGETEPPAWYERSIQATAEQMRRGQNPPEGLSAAEQRSWTRAYNQSQAEAPFSRGGRYWTPADEARYLQSNPAEAPLPTGLTEGEQAASPLLNRLFANPSGGALEATPIELQNAYRTNMAALNQARHYANVEDFMPMWNEMTPLGVTGPRAGAAGSLAETLAGGGGQIPTAGPTAGSSFLSNVMDKAFGYGDYPAYTTGIGGAIDRGVAWQTANMGKSLAAAVPGSLTAYFGPKLINNYLPAPTPVKDLLGNITAGAGIGSTGFALGPEIGVPTTIIGGLVGGFKGAMEDIFPDTKIIPFF